MEKTMVATQEALNLQAINNGLTNKITSGELVSKLDMIISEYIITKGNENGIDPECLHWLIFLKTLFLKTAIDNNEKLEFDELIGYYLS